MAAFGSQLQTIYGKALFEPEQAIREAALDALEGLMKFSKRIDPILKSLIDGVIRLESDTDQIGNIQDHINICEASLSMVGKAYISLADKCGVQNIESRFNDILKSPLFSSSHGERSIFLVSPHPPPLDQFATDAPDPLPLRLSPR